MYRASWMTNQVEGFDFNKLLQLIPAGVSFTIEEYLPGFGWVVC